MLNIIKENDYNIENLIIKNTITEFMIIDKQNF